MLTASVFDVLNAPVEERCKRSNSSCSFSGRRGGDGPVANANRQVVCEKKRREGRRNLGGKTRDIFIAVEDREGDVEFR